MENNKEYVAVGAAIRSLLMISADSEAAYAVREALDYLQIAEEEIVDAVNLI